MSEMAYVANQNSKIQSLLLNDCEAGNANKAPKLMSLDDYPHWKNRFEIYINGVDTNLWVIIENGYLRPLNMDGSPIMITRLTEPQRKDYDADKKAYAILSQSIATEIFHQFRQFTSSKALWDALEQRYEGNDALKKIKSKALRKEFNSFTSIGNESLDALITRYYHLLSELFNHQVQTTMLEKVQCLADALPSRWDSFLMVHKQSGSLGTMDINEFIMKLKEQEIEYQWKAKRGIPVQDPSLYYSSSIPSNQPATHAPLRTAFVSSTSDSSSYNQDQSSHQASQPSTPVTDSSTTSTKLQTDNFGKVTVEVAKEHVALLSTLVNSYNGLLAGQIGNVHLTDEDYNQLDKDELDQMDIMWAFASTVRKAKEFIKRTGRDIQVNKNSKLGFDIANVTCYNCGEKGHFAQQCTKPKKNGHRNPFNSKNQTNQSNHSNQTNYSKPNTERRMVSTESAYSNDSGNQNTALIVQSDEMEDWTIRFDGLTVDNKACVAEIHDQSTSTANADISLSSSNSDSNSDSESEADFTVQESLSEDSDVNTNSQESLFAMMAETTEEKVTSEQVSSEHSCARCKELELKVERYISHNTDLVEDLNQCVEANKVLKTNEHDFKAKIDSLNKIMHEMEIMVLNQQDEINSYLNMIDEQKKKMAILQCDYDTLNNKLKSYANSSYIVEHIICKNKTVNKKQGLGYSSVPPPVLNSFINTPNDHPISEFQVKTPLVVDPCNVDSPNAVDASDVESSPDTQQADG